MPCGGCEKVCKCTAEKCAEGCKCAQGKCGCHEAGVGKVTTASEGAVAKSCCHKEKKEE